MISAQVLHEQGLGKFCDPDFVRATSREMQEAMNMTQEEMDRAAHELLLEVKRHRHRRLGGRGRSPQNQDEYEGDDYDDFSEENEREGFDEEDEEDEDEDEEGADERENNSGDPLWNPGPDEEEDDDYDEETTDDGGQDRQCLADSRRLQRQFQRQLHERHRPLNNQQNDQVSRMDPRRDHVDDSAL